MGGEGNENFEKDIVLLALLVLLVSTAAFIAVRRTETVYSLDPSLVGKRVTVQGKIVHRINANGVWIAFLDTGVSKIKLVSFSGEPSNKTSFTGRVAEYKGDLELVIGE